MTNTTHAESPGERWKAFRRYGYNDIHITEEPGCITFRQRNKYSAKFMNWSLAVIFAIVFVPTVIVFVKAPNVEMTIYALGYLVAAGAICTPVALLIPYLAKRSTVLTVKAGAVGVHNGVDIHRLTIPLHNIRSIDVRGGQGATPYFVCIWDGPHAFDTLSNRSQDNAVTLRDGVLAALMVLNPPPEAAKPKSSVKGFPE